MWYNSWEIKRTNGLTFQLFNNIRLLPSLSFPDVLYICHDTQCQWLISLSLCEFAFMVLAVCVCLCVCVCVCVCMSERERERERERENVCYNCVPTFNKEWVGIVGEVCAWLPHTTPCLVLWKIHMKKYQRSIQYTCTSLFITYLSNSCVFSYFLYFL